MDRLAPPELLDELRAVQADLSHLHVFRWTTDGARLPLASGADLWPDVLAEVSAAHEPSRWIADRFAFLEFVRDDDPEQLRADAATLRGWLASEPPAGG